MVADSFRAPTTGRDPVRPRLCVVVVAVALGLGCASGAPTGSLPGSSSPSWPQGDPKVLFEKVVETEGDLGRSLLLRRLTGQGPQPLFERPYGVAWDGKDLLVTDPGAGVVLKLTEKGKIYRTRQELLVGPIGVTACFDGVVVADARSGRLGLFNEHLHFVRWLAEDLERPTGVACVNGGVAVVETAAHRIVIIELDGTRRELGARGAGAGEFNFPAAIASAGDVLWVGDTLNFRIQEIDVETGRSLGNFGHLGDSPGETPRIKGLAMDVQGHVWVSDAHLDLIALFDRDGLFLINIGGPGRENGEFSFPAGIAAHPDGRVAVVDSLNRRVQILRVVDSKGHSREGQ